MTTPKSAHDAAAAAASTLADVDQQIAERSTGPGAFERDEPGLAGDAEVLAWTDLDDDVVTRVAAVGVISTNRDLTQRSLRDFLR